MENKQQNGDRSRPRASAAGADRGRARSRHTVERVTVSFGSGRSMPGGFENDEAHAPADAKRSHAPRPSGRTGREQRLNAPPDRLRTENRRRQFEDGSRTPRSGATVRTSSHPPERGGYQGIVSPALVEGVGRAGGFGSSLLRGLAALAVVCCVVGGGVTLFGALASGGEHDAPFDGSSELSSAVDGALTTVVAQRPHLGLDADDLSVVPGGSEVSAFSVFEGTSEPLGESQPAALKSAISAFGDSGYHVGFVMIDLTTGRGLSYNAHADFFSASTVKAPFVTFLWQEFIEGGTAETGDMLTKDAVYGGTGVMASEEDTDEYTLEEVMANTIMYSDNTGYAMLRNQYDGESWDAWTAEAGVPQAESEAGWYYDYCACDLAKYWLAIDAYLETDTAGAQRVEDLFGSTEVSFIRQALGSECEVCAKAGFESSFVGSAAALNDAGIVKSPEGDYLIAVMSDADYSHPDMTENGSLIVDLVKALDDVHDDTLAV